MTRKVVVGSLDDERPEAVTEWLRGWANWSSNTTWRLVEQDIVDWVMVLEDVIVAQRELLRDFAKKNESE